MSLIKTSVKHLVFEVKYKYSDLELNTDNEFVNYFQTLDDVCNYIRSIEKEMSIVDNKFYSCRANPRISVKSCGISDRKYVSLFKNCV